jgi:hypothetical protein
MYAVQYAKDHILSIGQTLDYHIDIVDANDVHFALKKGTSILEQLRECVCY